MGRLSGSDAGSDGGFRSGREALLEFLTLGELITSVPCAAGLGNGLLGGAAGVGVAALNGGHFGGFELGEASSEGGLVGAVGVSGQINAVVGETVFLSDGERVAREEDGG